MSLLLAASSSGTIFPAPTASLMRRDAVALFLSLMPKRSRRDGYILVNPGWETAEDRNRFERNYTKALETKDLQAALDFISYFITLGYTAFIHEYPGMPFQCYVVKSGFGKV
jgi:hypothetical protein